MRYHLIVLTDLSDMLAIYWGMAGGRWVVRLCGELDISSAERLFGAVVMGRRVAGVRHVAVDLSEVTFADPGGLHPLIAAHLLLSSAGCGLSVEGAVGHVAELFTLTGLAELCGGPPPRSR